MKQDKTWISDKALNNLWDFVSAVSAIIAIPKIVYSRSAISMMPSVPSWVFYMFKFGLEFLDA